MPFWIPISKGRIDFMKQKERFDEKPKQEHTEPVHHRKAIIGHLVERGARLFIVLAVRILFLQIQLFMFRQICRNALILLGNRQFTLMVLPRKCPGIAYTLHTALSSVSAAGTLLQYSSTLRIS